MFCNKCGAKIDGDSNFCVECGASVVKGSADASQPETEPAPAPDTEPASEPTPEPEPAPASEATTDQPRRSRAPMVIIGVSAAVILVCVGIIFAFTVFKPRTYAVNLPVSIPGLDEAGSRVPVQAHRVDVQMGPTVHVYLSSTGDGLELEPGTWEIKPEGSPIAKDGTIYQYDVEPVTMQVDKADDDTATAKASATLELAPVSPAFVTDDQVSKAVEWAKGDGSRASGDTPAPNVDELVKKVDAKKDAGPYDFLLTKIKWVQAGGWMVDLGVSDLPMNGPFHVTSKDAIAGANTAKLDYAIADINNDGTQELFLRISGPTQDGMSDSAYMMAYTVVDGNPVCIDKSPWHFEATRAWCALDSAGRIVKYGSGGMAHSYEFYELSGGQLVVKDKYDSDHYDQSAPKVTHNGQPISDDEFVAATKFEAYGLDWQPVSDYQTGDPQPVDEGSVSELCKSRLKAVREVLDIWYPLKDASSGPEGDREAGGNGTAPQSYFDHFKLGMGGSRHGDLTGIPNVQNRPYDDVLGAAIWCAGRAANKHIDFFSGETMIASPVANDMVRLSIKGSSATEAQYGTVAPKNANLELLIGFEDNSALITDVIPLSYEVTG